MGAKIINLTAEEFWEVGKRASKEVESWPEWKKTGHDSLCSRETIENRIKPKKKKIKMTKNNKTKIEIIDSFDYEMNKYITRYSNRFDTKLKYYLRSDCKNIKSLINNYKFIGSYEYNSIFPEKIKKESGQFSVSEFIENEELESKSFKKDEFKLFCSKVRELKNLIDNEDNYIIFRNLESCVCFYDCTCTELDRTKIYFFEIQKETEDERESRIKYLEEEKRKKEEEDKKLNDKEKELYETLKKKFEK